MNYNFQPPIFPTYNLHCYISYNQSSIFNNSLFFYQFVRLLSRSFLFLQIILSLAFMLSFSSSSQALTSQTLNMINGNAPYLTFDNGQTKVNNLDDELFKITLSDGKEITPVTNRSSTIPIELPNTNETLADIVTLVPAGSDSVELSSLLGAPNNYWGDDDGDVDFTITGSLNLTMTDKNNQIVARNARLDICNAPYKVTLSNTDAILKTRYGIPNGKNIIGRSVTYYINPKASPLICFVRSNLENNPLVNDHDFNGPVSMWDPDKGFKPQLTYDLNFPTTGANKLHFYLDIGGARPLVWSVSVDKEDGGITANIANNDDLLANGDGSLVRVTLEGPFAKKLQWESVTPDEIVKPNLPLTFELVGRYDSKGPVIVKYGFVLKQWFVNRGKESHRYNNTKNWCEKISYGIPRVRDLTNGACSGAGYIEYCKGAIGADPQATDNYFKRVIGKGFFSEWGNMDDEKFYKNANFGHHGYWTKDIGHEKSNETFQLDTNEEGESENPFQLDVYSVDGQINWNYARKNGAYSLCVWPDPGSD